LPTHQKSRLLNLDKSPMICCLIWLLSYEGTISNPFPKERITSAVTTVVLYYCRHVKHSSGDSGCTIVLLSFSAFFSG